MTVYSLVGLIAAIAVVVSIIRRFIQTPQSAIVAYLQDFIGVFFIFSGTVKAIDPLGTAYKMSEYFAELGLSPLEAIGTQLSVFMIVLEIVLGVALILGYRKNFMLILLLLTIIFFTFLTGYTYLSGWDFSTWVFDERKMKVTDCGCFGDFLKLKPWVSFYKDIGLTVIIVILNLSRNKIKPLFSSNVSTAIVMLAIVGSFLYCLSNFLWGLPQVDFRPYAVGENIPENMKPIRAKKALYIYTFKNTATGEEKEMVFPNKPEGDGWERVSGSRRDSVLDPGEPARIASFQLNDSEGNLMNDEVLNNDDYTFMVVAYKLPDTDVKTFTEKLNPMAAAAEKDGKMFFVATASDYESFRHEVQASYPFYGGDETVLKAIIRSNPGLVLMKNGTVLAKWHYKHIPSYEEIKKEYFK